MGRKKLVKWLKLAGLCIAGVVTVSIPLTMALVLSAAGSSDVPAHGGLESQQHRTVERAMRVRPGDVVLLLEGRDGALRVVPEIVSRLRERGTWLRFPAESRRAARRAAFDAIGARP